MGTVVVSVQTDGHGDTIGHVGVKSEAFIGVCGVYKL